MSGGFILGDEGSGCALGRQFASDCLKGIAPKDLSDAFFEEYRLDKDAMVESMYKFPDVSRTLATYACFLAMHSANPYVENLVQEEFSRFFRRNILLYPAYREVKIGFVGSIAVSFEEILRETGRIYGVNISSISASSMEGLVKYHARH